MRSPISCYRLLLCAMMLLCCLLSFSQVRYPAARTQAFDTTILGIKASDPFFWMSRKENEQEVTRFAQEQTNLAFSILDRIPGAPAIDKEMEETYAALDAEFWSLHAVGNSIYYYRSIPGEGYWLCRRAGMAAPEEKILSNNIVIHGQRYAVRKRAFAHRKPLLALMLTQKGETNPQIRIYDMDRKQFLADSIAPVMFNDARGVSMAWLPNDEALLYTQAPPAAVPQEIYFRGKIRLHTVGKAQAEDTDIFGIGLNPDIALKPQETPYIYSFRHSPYLVARIRTSDDDNYAFAVHYQQLNGKQTPWKRLKNYRNLGEGFDAHDQFLYAATEGGAKRMVVKINMETGESPEPFIAQPEHLVAATDFTHQSGIVAGKDVLYVLIRKIGDMQILKADLPSKRTDYIALPGKGTVSEMSLLGDNDLVFAHSSAVKSLQYHSYQHKAAAATPLPFAPKVFDASNRMETQVIQVPSRDGKLIPVSLVYRKGLDLKNDNRLLIDAYGNGGASKDLSLDPNMIPWIMRDGIYAYAHVRGGGELGEAWRKEGHYPTKMNSIHDILDVAAYFIHHHYTSRDKQLVMGQSAGAFLVGMGINKGPDLFAGGIFLQGLPDLFTYTDAAFGRESAAGPKDTREGLQSNYDISALYHVPENSRLPAMFIAHGATDYLMGLHPAARYAARLQRAQKGERPILLMVDPEGGHLGGPGESLNILKFALWQTGHPDFQPGQ